MNRLRHISAVAAAAFAASLSFSLAACDDSTSASNDEVQASSASPESSAFPSSSSSLEPDSASCDSVISSAYPYGCSDSLQIDGVYYSMNGYFRSVGRGCTYRCQDNKWSYVSTIPDGAEYFSDMDMAPPSEYVQKLLFKKCNAENEGIVDVLGTGSGNPKGGRSRVYYRCEQGVWVESPEWVACDTAGVTEGAICRIQISFRGSQFGVDAWLCYKYAGEGVWESSSCPTEPEKECVNNDAKEEIVFTNDTLFFKCSGRKWREISVGEYYCSTGNESVGDTCSFERDGQKKYFRYDSIPEADSRWVEAAFDPELGFCTLNSHDHWDREYGQKGDDYYYCSYLNGTTWLQTDLVPRQYTDPRKEGLTDEEYDVLDLPKDATVGALVGGLLEECVHDRTFNYFETNGMEDNETYDYCKPNHYYRCGDDGSWKEEIIYKSMGFYFDKPNNEICGEDEMCCAETEGAKYLYSAESTGPELIYQCVSGESIFVEYAGRYEKKSK
jgi:hypothetical protein